MELRRTLAACAAVLALAGPAHAFGGAGSYLAARHASYQNDYVRAAEYYTRALVLDPGNPELLEAALNANVGLGHFDRALDVAERMDEAGIESQIATIVRMVDFGTREDWDGMLAALEGGAEIGGLVDGLLRGWALMGAGRADDALAAFDALADRDGLEAFALYHKALALASVGDFEGADDILSGRAEGPLQASRRGIKAHMQILSQLDRPEAAEELVDKALGSTPAPVFVDLLDRMAAGETLSYDVAVNGREGIAESFFSVASVLAGETAPGYALIYSRAAEALDPGHVDAMLLSASFLEEMERYDLATVAYEQVPRDHGAFVAAELGRAQALNEAGRDDEAVAVLRKLAESRPDLLLVHVSLGDTLRRLERFEEAVPAYDRAVALIDTPDQQHWVLYFSRGISLERTDRWDEAEADFRTALDLNPGQPQVLNYLGYSLVELRDNLDEALDMIERAVAARPDDGYITDSLGWVYYRLGRYEDAVAPMERAVELTPMDPIINDHLGDVYWAVGRRLEARFQWKRALSLDPEPDEAERIRRKLEVGLDVVLNEEGAAPPNVASDG